MRNDFWKLALKYVLALAGAYALAAFYQALSNFYQAGWQLVLLVNGFAAMALVFLSQAIRDDLSPSKLQWKLLMPALVWVGAAALSAGLTRQIWPLTTLPEPMSRGIYYQALLLIGLVPLAEELIFRGYLGPLIHRHSLPLPIYTNGLLFAVAHTQASFTQLPAPPIGPLLLGLLCEWSRVRTKSLWMPISLHMAANTTALVFDALDPRWLDWLRLLYLSP